MNLPVNKTAVHVPTEEQAKVFLKKLWEENSVSFSGVQGNNWDAYKENTVYFIQKGNEYLTYANLDFAHREHYPITDVSEYIEDNIIIGYDFKSDKYLKAATDLVSFPFKKFKENHGVHLPLSSIHLPKLKSLGVLDIWTEPVYGKKVLFKTEEGNNVREGDSYWCVNSKTKSIWEQTANARTELGRDVKAFTSNILARTYHKSLMKLPSFSNYEGMDNGDSLSWGCFEVSKDKIQDIINLGITSFIIKYEGSRIEIDEESFKEIKEYIK